MAPTSVLATVKGGKGVIAIPPTASTAAIGRSAMGAVCSKRLGAKVVQAGVKLGTLPIVQAVAVQGAIVGVHPADNHFGSERADRRLTLNADLAPSDGAERRPLNGGDGYG